MDTICASSYLNIFMANFESKIPIFRIQDAILRCPYILKQEQIPSNNHLQKTNRQTGISVAPSYH